jgi:tRNA-modifying protein YgfZ
MLLWNDFLRTRGASFDAATVAGFGDPVGELAAARDAAVLCDLAPLASLAVAGPDAAAFLQGQMTNDVETLVVGASQFSAWCSPKGRVLANFLLRRVAEDSFELLLPVSLSEPIRKRLSMFVFRSRVTLADASDATVRLGAGGPTAATHLAAAFGAVPALHRSTAIEGGTLIALPGGRFVACVVPEGAPVLWQRLSAAALCAAGFPCWQWLTVRAAVPVITPPTQDQFIPQMLNLDALDGVSFRKGCYTGQEIVARTQYLGRLKERLALAHADAAPPPAGTRIFAAAFGDQPCGTVVNAAAAPGGGVDLLAVAQSAAIASGALRLGAADGPVASVLPLPYPLPAASEPRGRIA